MTSNHNIDLPKEKASEYRYLEAFVLGLGRGGGIRTHDPLVPNQMRYQAALRPDQDRHSSALLHPFLEQSKINWQIVTAAA